MIEIYISNKKLDLIDDIDVNFTYSSIDTQNPSAVKNSFSKTVSVPSTPNNDEIFGHIWRFDSYITSSNPNSYTGVYFDPHKRTPFYIMRNGAVIENGYCVLESISMRENEKTYNLNLFGGLGEFFFNLMYDEDGKEKNLTDLYWKWIPYRSYNSLDWESDPLTEDEENSQLLYRLNSANVCAAWPIFDPNDNLAYDSKSFICSDVMFLPMYYGYNNDFISNKILVNNYQRNNSGDTGTTISSNWNSFLPVQYQEDTDVYGLYEQDTVNSYGLLETPRDLDPTEARDFRVTNMPMAIRVSKLMNRIADPDNNGGYTVVWDSKIKDSYWWKYGFILTDTPEYDLDNIQEAEYNFSNMTLSDEWSYTTAGGTWSYSPTSDQIQTISSQASTTNMSQPKFVLKVKPNITVKAHKNQSDASKVASLGSLCLSAQGNVLKSSNALCWLVDFYDNDDTLRYSYLCMASFSNTGDHFGSNYYISNTSYANGYISSTNQMMSKVIAYVNTRFSRSLTTANYRLIDSIPVKQTGSTNINTYGAYYYYKVDNVDEHLKYTIDLPTTITDMKVKVTNFELNYYLEVKGSTISDYVLGRTTSDLSTLYSKIGTLFGGNLMRFNFLAMFGYKVINDAVGSGNAYKAFGYVMTTGGGQGPHFSNYYGGSSVTSKYTTYLYEGAQITSYLDIYKKTLLNNTKSPYKYLIDFAKLLNLRFLYDKNEKKITILPHGKYWINKTIDINDKVDVGREINIKHLFDKTKFIKFNLDTPDTWAETVYKKLSKYEYGEYIKDTGIQFNKESKNLLEGLMYSNSILWQNKSIYYDGNNIGRYFLPTPTNQNIFDWTLFKVDGDETKSLTRSQSGSNCIDTIDELPRIGSFDKDNKSVKIGTTFVFYNGLVKNFTTSNAVTASTMTTLTPSSVVSGSYVNNNGGISSSTIQSINVYDVTAYDIQHYTYKVTFNFTAGSSTYAIYYFDSGGTPTGREYVKGNSTIVDGILTIPSGTTTIKFSYMTADTTAKLKRSVPGYALSPYFTVSDNTRIQQQLSGGYCYYYGFKADGDGFGTGVACTACAASWYVPYFSRDLYNTFKSSTSTWTQQTKLLASWDITEPENILYDDTHLQFITNKNVSYSFPVASEPVNFEDAVAYSKSSNSYIFGNFWKDFINDFYDRNSKEITCYCKIEEAPEVALRKFYYFRGSLWIMTKIENYKLNFYEDNFSKVTLHKIVNKDHYLYSNKLSLEEVQNVINQGTSQQEQ